MKKVIDVVFLEGAETLIKLTMNCADVICNACATAITGARFKCLVCLDFDVCHQCIDRASNEHDPLNHILMQFDCPSAKGVKSTVLKRQSDIMEQLLILEGLEDYGLDADTISIKLKLSIEKVKQTLKRLCKDVDRHISSFRDEIDDTPRLICTPVRPERKVYDDVDIPLRSVWESLLKLNAIDLNDTTSNELSDGALDFNIMVKCTQDVNQLNAHDLSCVLRIKPIAELANRQDQIQKRLQQVPVLLAPDKSKASTALKKRLQVAIKSQSRSKTEKTTWDLVEYALGRDFKGVSLADRPVAQATRKRKLEASQPKKDNKDRQGNQVNSNQLSNIDREKYINASSKEAAKRDKENQKHAQCVKDAVLVLPAMTRNGRVYSNQVAAVESDNEEDSSEDTTTGNDSMTIIEVVENEREQNDASYSCSVEHLPFSSRSPCINLRVFSSQYRQSMFKVQLNTMANPSTPGVDFEPTAVLPRSLIPIVTSVVPNSAIQKSSCVVSRTSTQSLLYHMVCGAMRWLKTEFEVPNQEVLICMPERNCIEIRFNHDKTLRMVLSAELLRAMTETFRPTPFKSANQQIKGIISNLPVLEDFLDNFGEMHEAEPATMVDTRCDIDVDKFFISSNDQQSGLFEPIQSYPSTASSVIPVKCFPASPLSFNRLLSTFDIIVPSKDWDECLWLDDPTYSSSTVNSYNVEKIGSPKDPSAGIASYSPPSLRSILKKRSISTVSLSSFASKNSWYCGYASSKRSAKRVRFEGYPDDVEPSTQGDEEEETPTVIDDDESLSSACPKLIELTTDSNHSTSDESMDVTFSKIEQSPYSLFDEVFNSLWLQPSPGCPVHTDTSSGSDRMETDCSEESESSSNHSTIDDEILFSIDSSPTANTYQSAILNWLFDDLNAYSAAKPTLKPSKHSTIARSSIRLQQKRQNSTPLVL